MAHILNIMVRPFLYVIAEAGYKTLLDQLFKGEKTLCNTGQWLIDAAV
jgi:hypothetical protein